MHYECVAMKSDGKRARVTFYAVDTEGDTNEHAGRIVATLSRENAAEFKVGERYAADLRLPALPREQA